MIKTILREPRFPDKHINWKFEDAGFKCRFHQRLDGMLDAGSILPAGLLWVNRDTDTNRLKDLLTFMSNAKSGKPKVYILKFIY